MRLVQRAAKASFARDSDVAVVVGARRVDVMIDYCPGRITNPEPRSPQPLGHLGFFLVAGCSRAQTFVERTDLAQRRRTKRHIRTYHATNFDDAITMVDQRQVEIHSRRSDFFHWILSRQNPPLHRGELRMRGKKALDFADVIRRDH